MAEVGVIEKPQHTPNFIRELFREDALVAREVLMGILTGGIHLTEPAAEVAVARSVGILGCPHTTPLQVPTITERLNAAKLILQTGVGFKVDHTTDDESIRAQVVVMPLWDDDPRLKNSPVKGALTDGKPTNGDRSAGDSAAGRGSDGNGKRGR